MLLITGIAVTLINGEWQPSSGKANSETWNAPGTDFSHKKIFILCVTGLRSSAFGPASKGRRAFMAGKK